MTTMKCTKLLLLLTLVTTVSHFTVPVEGLFNVEVLVTVVSNPFNTTFDNTCCEDDCSACSSIFFFCLRPEGSLINDDCIWGNYSSAGHPVTESRMTFLGPGEIGLIIGNVSNPLLFTGDVWPGSFQFETRLDHYNFESNTTVLIDRLITEVNPAPLSSSFSILTVGTGLQNNVVMFFKYRVMCQPNYYGSDCATLCIPTNDQNSHYTCNPDGTKSCLEGYIDPSTNCVNSNVLTTPHTGLVCPAEVKQGISFPETIAGQTAEVPCLQYEDQSFTVLGNVLRMCYENGTWSPNIDTFRCSREDFQMIDSRASVVFGQLMNAIAPGDVQDLIAELSQATHVSTLPQETSHFLQDLRITTRVVNQSIDYLRFNLDTDDTPLDFNEDIFDAINNVLDVHNIDGWKALQTDDAGTERILQSTEGYGEYVASALHSDRVDTGAGSEKVLNKTNIALRAAMFSSAVNDTYPRNVDEGETFAQSIIPSSILSGNTTVVNILFKNLEQFLPEDDLAAMNNGTVVGSPVISTQVLTNQDEKLTNFSAPIRFRFRTLEMEIDNKTMAIENVRCVFWDFTPGVRDLSQTTWAQTGLTTKLEPIEVEKNNTLIVHCISKHLTSFAVLMDVRSVLDVITREERLALEIVTYIGLGLSILFLILTILLLLCVMRKLIIEQLLYFIHLNLAIALLLANVTFIAGINHAASNRYACVVVAGLLHYLYTAAFYWMLCEGIMLYFKVVITFSRVGKYLSAKWWFFFLIGWGIPIIPVAISIGLIHEQYGNSEYCWIAVNDYKGGALWAFVVPFAVVFVLNTLIFIAALVRIFKSRKGKLEHSESKAQKLCRMLFYNGMSILPLLGLTWAFGLLAINQATTVFLWLFTIFNSLQGALIFFFQILQSPKIWNWLKKRKEQAEKSIQTKSTIASKGKRRTSQSYKILSSSTGTSQGTLQHASYAKSTTLSKLKSTRVQPGIGFTNPVVEDTLTKEDLSTEFTKEDLSADIFKPA